jgi:hypothetical protein
MRGFGLNMGALLNRKYDIMQQEADAATTAANARAVGAQRPLVPDASIAGGAGIAEPFEDPALKLLEQQKLTAQIGAANADAANARSQATVREDEFRTNKRIADQGNVAGTPDTTQTRLTVGEKMGLKGDALLEYVRTGVAPLKRGLTKVPGKGKKDSVPALLQPGEAVLNAAAAKKLGRGLIAHLNAYGNSKAAKKGLV